MSGMVAERLLNLVPPLLDPAAKFELVRKIRAAYTKRCKRTIYCSPENLRSAVGPVVNQLVAQSSSLQLPPHVVARIRWLADGDTVEANKILTAVEEEEASIRLRYLDAEIRQIESMISSLRGEMEIKHEIILPQGNILVHVREKRALGCLAAIFPFLLLFRP